MDLKQYSMNVRINTNNNIVAVFVIVPAIISRKRTQPSSFTRRGHTTEVKVCVTMRRRLQWNQAASARVTNLSTHRQRSGAERPRALRFADGFMSTAVCLSAEQ